MTHTPGPWENHGAMIIGPNGAIAVDPSSVGMAAADHNSEANARLIAAAPDLLKCLQGFLDWYDYTDGSGDVPAYVAPSTEARAALAKARGEQ